MAWSLVDHLRMLSVDKTSVASVIAASVAKESVSIPLINPPQASVERPNRYGLTPREAEIVGAIGEAMTNKDIAVHFGISEYTVKHHLTKIFDKVGVDSRLELAMFAKHHGLVEADAVA
jgi:DNA-binding NarL/FixJ family response regulator